MTYVTDSLHLSGQNKYPAKRWADLYFPKQERPFEEIFNEVVENCGLEAID